MREGEGGINRERIKDICTTLPCGKTASGKLLYGTVSSAQSSVMTQRHGVSGWGEAASRGREYRYTHN